MVARSYTLGWVLLVAVVAPRAAPADEVPTEQLAQIQLEQQKAEAEINARYGNKLPSELSSEERGQIIQEQQQAADRIYEEHGVTAKDVARSEATLDKGERAELDEAKETLEAKAEAAKTAGDKASGDKAAQGEASGEVEIIRGTSDEEPVELWRDEAAVQTDRPGEDGVSNLPVDGEIEGAEAPASTEAP